MVDFMLRCCPPTFLLPEVANIHRKDGIVMFHGAYEIASDVIYIWCSVAHPPPVFLLVYRLVESIYLLCLAVSRLKGV